MAHAPHIHAPHHVPEALTRLPRRVVRRVCEALVVLAGLTIVLPWIGLVIAGLFDKNFVPFHLTAIQNLFTILTISAAGSLLVGLAGMFLCRSERPVN
jgi:hypothetical protein